MLSREDNELMCQVGPGTPMGNLMRQYWIPALMPSELPAPDCPPMRLRLLGENLIAFRVTSGAVGIVANACPHRGASLFFGRNEEEGLRCVYHGWKFDVAGQCVDMPSEPPESNFKSKVKAVAYPCIERNNVIWTYMGPRREDLPPLPDLPSNLSPDCIVSKTVRVCSYMQALEGDIDTVHFAFLHQGHTEYDEYPPGSENYYGLRQRHAKLEVRDHALGASYGAYRPADDGKDYWRMGHFLMPFYTLNAQANLTQRTGFRAWVPIDDDHVMDWSVHIPQPRDQYGKPGVGGIFAAQRIGRPANSPGPIFPGNPDYYLPDTSDWIGKFRPVQNLANDYLIDREAQRNKVSYTGLPNGADPEDRGIQESMGDIYYRTQEHLATTDNMIIRTRRLLINHAKAFRDRGVVPPGVEQPKLYRMYSGGALVPSNVSGLDYCHDIMFGRAQTVEVPAET